MKTTLSCDRSLAPNIALKICEHSELGELVGYWTGYWMPNKQIVRLYPAANPFCTWKVPRNVHSVNDGLILISKREINERQTQSTSAKKENGFHSREIKGQVKFIF